MKWKLRTQCDKETHLLITESTEVARLPCQEEKGGAMRIKESERERWFGEYELFKWYCQKIRTAIRLLLIFQSWVTHHYF